MWSNRSSPLYKDINYLLSYTCGNRHPYCEFTVMYSSYCHAWKLWTRLQCSKQFWYMYNEAITVNVLSNILIFSTAANINICVCVCVYIVCWRVVKNWFLCRSVSCQNVVHLQVSKLSIPGEYGHFIDCCINSCPYFYTLLH